MVMIRSDEHRGNVANGEYDLGWMSPRSEWGVRVQRSKRGLTLSDISIGSYGTVPDDASASRTFVPRGADHDPDDMPDIGSTLNKRSEVWSGNVATLYEEAIARQWSSTRDVPWDSLRPLSDDLEHAMCQICTFLSEVEFLAADGPGLWMGQINNAFFETKLFLATQINDEARHVEVFRKRALANGGGLGRCPREVEEVNKQIADIRSFTQMLARLHLLGEGRVLTFFRMGELVAQNEAEKTMFRLCAQDEARHVAFGCLQLRELIAEDPDRVEEIHQVLDAGEDLIVQMGSTPEQIEPLLILLGGGIDDMEIGRERLAYMRKKVVEEYLQRCRSIGINRQERCRLTGAKNINLL